MPEELEIALKNLKDAVAFMDKRNAASEDDKIAVGSDHWTWLETAARDVVKAL